MSSDETLYVSNGNEFYEIPVEDLQEAREDGFYIPSEQGMCIVSNGDEIFEIPIDDLEEAESDGFHAITPTDDSEQSLSSDQINNTSSAETVTGQLIQDTCIITPVMAPDKQSRKTSSTSEKQPHEVDSAFFEIDTITEEDLHRAELKKEFEASNGIDKLKVGWQLYGPTWQTTKERVTTYGVSALLHVVIMFGLIFIVITSPQFEYEEILSSIADTELEEQGEIETVTLDNLDNTDTNEDASDEVTELAALKALNKPATTIDANDFIKDIKLADLAGGSNVNGLSTLTGQTQAARGAATAKYGGSAGSEAAVEAGLDWLSRHQAEDGSWCFNHQQAVKCNCGSAGTHKGRTGATGLALLCYLGAGYTYAEGKHSARISKGIQYLLSKMEISSEGYGDLREPGSGNGGIYQHAIATAALCEALSVNLALQTLRRKKGGLQMIDSEGRELTSEDLRKNFRTLKHACQLAVNYMLHHQSSKTGGWGYTPKSPGDLSVTGWQVYALLSAEHARLIIPKVHWVRVQKYLDSVAHDSGVKYSYKTGRSANNSMTAVGLFCRMLSGWRRNNAKIKSGVKFLSQVGPSVTGMYYSYYATQVLFAYGDDDEEQLWTEWNLKMRDGLVARQAKHGHASGSWSGGNGQGGRHFETCLSILTLEIYYRKLPMLQRLAVEPMKLD